MAVCIYIYNILHVFIYIYIYTHSGPTKHIEPHESSLAQSRRPPQECDQQPGYSMAKTCEKPSVQTEKYVSSLEGKIKEVQTLQLECNASCVTEHDASNYVCVQISCFLMPPQPSSLIEQYLSSLHFGVLHVFITHHHLPLSKL